VDRPPDGFVNTVIGERCDFKAMDRYQNNATRSDVMRCHRCHVVSFGEIGDTILNIRSLTVNLNDLCSWREQMRQVWDHGR